MKNNFFMNTKYWDWNGYKIAWDVSGEENLIPIILIHGFGASKFHWRNNINFFRHKGFAVYSLDLLGFGESAQPSFNSIGAIDNGIWCDQVTDFISDVIRPKNREKIILIGNSLGSLVALTCAVAIPDEISAIIASPLPDEVNFKKKLLTNQTSKIKKIFIKTLFIILPIEIILFLVRKFGVINLGLNAAYHKKNNINKELIEIVTKPASRKNAAKTLRAMCIGMSIRNEKLKAPYLLKMLCKIQEIPMLLIWGEKDNFIPLFLGKKIAKFYSSVELSVIPNSGHCVHDEDHFMFNKISYHWIKNLKTFKK